MSTLTLAEAITRVQEAQYGLACAVADLKHAQRMARVISREQIETALRERYPHADRRGLELMVTGYKLALEERP